MIRRLRVRHRWAMPLVGAAVGTIAVLGLLARPSFPRLEAPASAPTVSRSALVFQESGMHGWLELSPGRMLLALERRPTLDDPLVGIWWAPSLPAARGALPEEARWLGRLDETARQTFAVAPPLPAGEGALVLYSLTEFAVLDAAPLSIPPGGDRGERS